MTRRACVLAAIVAAGLSAVAVTGAVPAVRQDPPAPQATFRSVTEIVSVDVSVRNRNRGPMSGLKVDEFTLLDNGVRQEISEMSFGKVPIDVTIGLDVSASVTGALLDRLRRAIVQLMRDLGKDDRLKLMLFNMRINRVVDFTTDEAAVERAIRTAVAGGGTTLMDTVSVALVSASSADRRQLLMFFTDGADSSSTTDASGLGAVAYRTRGTIVFVMPMAVAPAVFGPGLTTVMGPTSLTLRPRDLMLQRLAVETGGSLIPVNATADLGVAFRRVLDDFRSTYVLRYTPKGVTRDGFHDLEVTVAREGATVLARRGYFGG